MENLLIQLILMIALVYSVITIMKYGWLLYNAVKYSSEDTNNQINLLSMIGYDLPLSISYTLSYLIIF